MYFDGASQTNPRGGQVARVGIVLISPQNHVIPLAFSLTEPCTNNVAEYNALLIGLQLAHQLGVRNLQAYSDSELIVNQLRGQYEVRSDDLIPYFDSALQMAEQFEGFYIGHVRGGMPERNGLCKKSLSPEMDLPQRSCRIQYSQSTSGNIKRRSQV